MSVININDKNSLQNAAKVLKEGGILVFPTDTVYGIGCLMNELAIRRLYAIKNRPLSQPTAILFVKKIILKICSSINKGLNIPEDIKRGFRKGKITLLMPIDRINIRHIKILVKDNKIGIRLPKYQWLEKLINIVGPIVASSANKKGERPPAKFEAIDQDIIKLADLTIKTDQKLPGKPSRVYDLELKKDLR